MSAATARFLIGWAALLAASLVSCERGLGREVVGHVPDGADGRDINCLPPPECHRIPGPPGPIVPPALAPFAAAACAGAPATVAWTLAVGSEAPPVPLDCVRVDVRVAPSPTPLRVLDLAARGAELTFTAEQPATIELPRARLVATKIALAGPITLLVTDESELNEVLLESAPQTAAMVALKEVGGIGLGVNNPAGELQVTRSRLYDAQLFARVLTLETVQVQTAVISAERLFAVQARGREVRVEASWADLSGFELAALSITRCGTVLIAGSRLFGATFAPCTQEPLRIERSDVDSSFVAGSVESTSTFWRGTLFGATGEASLEAWRGGFFQNTLCGGLSRATLYAQGLKLCNACEQLPQPEQRLCEVEDPPNSLLVPPEADEGAPTDPFNPRCPALDTLFVCDPAPEAENPF